MGEVAAIEQSSDFVGKRNRHGTCPCAEVFEQIYHFNSTERWKVIRCPTTAAIGSLTVPLQEETILNLCKLHGRGAFLVVVSHVVDHSATRAARHSGVYPLTCPMSTPNMFARGRSPLELIGQNN